MCKFDKENLCRFFHWLTGHLNYVPMSQNKPPKAGNDELIGSWGIYTDIKIGNWNYV